MTFCKAEGIEVNLEEKCVTSYIIGPRNEKNVHTITHFNDVLVPAVKLQAHISTVTANKKRNGNYNICLVGLT